MNGPLVFLALALVAVAAADGLLALCGWVQARRAARAEALRQHYLDAVAVFYAYEKATRRRVCLDGCVCPPHELWVTPWTTPRALVRDAAVLAAVLDDVDATDALSSASARLRALLPSTPRPVLA